MECLVTRLDMVLEFWKFMAIVVVCGGSMVVKWWIKGVFGSLDPKILTTPSSSPKALEIVCVRLIGAGRFADVAAGAGSITVSVVVGEENHIFSQGGAKNGRDKLPNVVLKAEEIVYSKANSEGRELEAVCGQSSTKDGNVYGKQPANTPFSISSVYNPQRLKIGVRTHKKVPIIDRSFIVYRSGLDVMFAAELRSKIFKDEGGGKRFKIRYIGME
ncbi:hypothetical protein Tco_1102411 [Tanacetum coccineum]